MLEGLSLDVPQNALAALPIEESTGGSWSSHGLQTWLIFSAMSEMAWWQVHQKPCQ